MFYFEFMKEYGVQVEKSYVRGKMTSDLFAHTPPLGSKSWHLLEDHLRSVADITGKMGSKWNAHDLCWVMGYLHDIGKVNPKFQKYLLAAHDGIKLPKQPHAASGAKSALDILGPFSMAILGHHRGLPDRSDFKGKLENVHDDELRAVQHFYQQNPVDPNLITFKNDKPDELQAEMLIRMAFSALVDADYLDTEYHFQQEKLSERGEYPVLSDYLKRLDQHLALFKQGGKVNDHRNQILSHCRKAASDSPGFFDLQVPTGGGKTLSGMAFALQHAINNGLDRIIIAIPYTSIIDQTAQVYESIFGKGAILEHHSSIEIEDEEDQTETESQRRLAAENWDCPVIVTTTVQLFESLLHNKPSRCRKLHNISRSVIILDEVQTLPVHHLGPILDVLGELVAHYGSSVVFSTATLPDLSSIEPAKIPKERTALVPDFQDHYEALKRVSFEIVKDSLPKEQVAKEIKDRYQILAVFNSRKDAVDVAKLCSEEEGVIHLSTLLCGHHRKQVIRNVRNRLSEGLAVRLISTQVIEAGVDLDFPIVMRALGPLDRIIQTAGRCNREGMRPEPGKCLVFKLADGRSPSGAYKTATQIAETFLHNLGESFDSPDVIATYTREVFRYVETGSLHDHTDRADIQKLRQEFQFEEVARTFKMIDQSTKTVIIESYKGADVGSLLSEWHWNPRNWHQRIAPYCISIFDHDFRRMSTEGLLREHESGAWIYSGFYDSVFGISPDASDPADLIV